MSKKENKQPEEIKEEKPVDEEIKEEEIPEVAEEPVSGETEATPEEAKEDNPAQELEKLQQQLAEEKDKHLRLMAEYDNFRKRSARERENIYADVKADTLNKLFPIYDNLERALQQETTDEAYRKGVEMIMSQFKESLKALGVTPIDAVGQTFDPTKHNAVMHIEDPDKGENEVVQELQKGFMLGDKVIRCSMVQVAN